MIWAACVDSSARGWRRRLEAKADPVPTVDFWYEFASTYSYPAAMRVETHAAGRGVVVHWRPFLLVPILAALGQSDSPINLNPANGRYMWRDLERTCARLALPLRRPEPFPQRSLLAARAALALEDARRPEFSRAVYAAEFGGGPPIAERETIAAILEAMGLDAGDVLDRATNAEIKDRLKGETARAQSLGVFGAPNLITADGEIFWGNDRLEEGLDWAVRLAR